MPRTPRIDIADHVYHVLNRANGRLPIFESDKDYLQFESILTDAVDFFDMRLLSYCLMPNHWHLVLYPRKDGDLARFMSWLTNTHTRRWHTENQTIGEGHLYQGRYKSFLCQDDDHFITLVRYVERNAKKANLIQNAEDWRWSSVWRREKGNLSQKKILSDWLVTIPDNYLNFLNQSQTAEEEEAIARSILKSDHFGSLDWSEELSNKLNLKQINRKGGPSDKG